MIFWYLFCATYLKLFLDDRDSNSIISNPYVFCKKLNLDTASNINVPRQLEEGMSCNGRITRRPIKSAICTQGGLLEWPSFVMICLTKALNECNTLMKRGYLTLKKSDPACVCILFRGVVGCHIIVTLVKSRISLDLNIYPKIKLIVEKQDGQYLVSLKRKSSLKYPLPPQASMCKIWQEWSNYIVCLSLILNLLTDSRHFQYNILQFYV